MGRWTWLNESTLTRLAAGAAGVLLGCEAFALAAGAAVLGVAAGDQHMKMGPIGDGMISGGAWVGGGIAAVLLLLVAVRLILLAVRLRPLRRMGRIVLVASLVVQALLAAFAFGGSGWTAFGVLAVVVLLIGVVLFAAPPPGAARGPRATAVTRGR
ncbi:hypothetical protein BIV57_04860 [Mangrovactinospora gilvigrisea]|uniref:Uncharacterized protein n=1 Tax=Mangrovactinospora gilvigrisea TaxID=1428644 RepID=A0A1J7CAP1_9ACTN|nr:hypothetical protein [Mangrovactinospora gilvigrisea]OIV38588.1 hypothetical protein BIV57_04860 [Mangrovactinospora gilvigrisea]